MARVAEMRVIVNNEEPPADARPEGLRLLEALLFASSEPLDEKRLAASLPSGIDLRGLLQRLQQEYSARGVNLVRIDGKWTFRTAGDLSWLLTREAVEARKLSRAAIVAGVRPRGADRPSSPPSRSSNSYSLPALCSGGARARSSSSGSSGSSSSRKAGSSDGAGTAKAGGSRPSSSPEPLSSSSPGKSPSSESPKCDRNVAVVP